MVKGIFGLWNFPLLNKVFTKKEETPLVWSAVARDITGTPPNLNGRVLTIKYDTTSPFSFVLAKTIKYTTKTSNAYNRLPEHTIILEQGQIISLDQQAKNNMKGWVTTLTLQEILEG